jgi:uncharacterized C2H2 Zn-finger protein
MGQLIGLSIGGPYIGLIVAIVVAVAIAPWLYTMKSGIMRAKCPKCNAVFDASRMFSAIHFGPLKQLKCPACDKISLMKTYAKDPVPWPTKEEKTLQPTETSLTSEELEKNRIEDSKYEHS